MPPYVELNLFTWQFLLVAPISLGVVQEGFGWGYVGLGFVVTVDVVIIVITA